MPEKTPDPMKVAAVIWQQLVDHQPATAAALLRQLRAMPADWPQRVFGVGREDAALQLAPTYEPGDAHVLPEIAPYTPDGIEQCQACLTDDVDLCRYHTGEATGFDYVGRPLREAAKTEPKLTVREYLIRSADADDAADRGEPAEVVAALRRGEQP